MNEELYPCDHCEVMRTKAEGGNIFTLCDVCWDKHFSNTTTQDHTFHTIAELWRAGIKKIVQFLTKHALNK